MKDYMGSDPGCACILAEMSWAGRFTRIHQHTRAFGLWPEAKWRLSDLVGGSILPLNKFHLVLEPQFELLQTDFLQLFVFT